MQRKAPKPPVPTLFTIVAVLFAVAIIGGAYMIGRSIGTPPEPEPSPSPTPPPTVPEQLAGYALSEATDPSMAPGSEMNVVRGNYTDGTNELVLVVARPQTNLEKFMTDGGVIELQAIEEPAEGESESPTPESPSPSPKGPTLMCGKSEDTGFAACGRLAEEDTAQLLYAATELTPEALQELLEGLPA